MAGAVRVDGRPWRRPGGLLGVGQRVEALIRLDRLADETARDAAFVMTAAAILYEDAALIAVDKPPGLPTHATLDPRRPHLVGLVGQFLSGRDGAPPYLGIHQRLDRDTSGVVVFSRDPAANPGLARAFAGREVVKVYHAVTARPPRLPPPEWRVVSRIEGAPAETDFKLLETMPGVLLVEARPSTGRKHQIRIHLAGGGLPIRGDDRYGGPSPLRMMLHAKSLAFRHPLSGAELRIESAYPEDFRRLIEASRAKTPALTKSARAPTKPGRGKSGPAKARRRERG